MAKKLLPLLAMGTIAAATTASPCAIINDLYTESGETSVAGSVAYACLMSMPFESNAAVTWITEYSKYLQFQSDLEMLAKPPSSYLSNKVDLLGGLESIQSRASRGGYTSQYQFDADVSDLISSANDGHLYFDELCSLSAFSFYSSLSLSAISSNGIAMPEIYVTADAGMPSQGYNTNVSPVHSINGVGVVSAIEAQSNYQNFQDPDARFNNMVLNLLVDGQGNDLYGLFSRDTVWRGIESYNVTFVNGSSISYPVMAELMASLDSVSFGDANDLYNGHSPTLYPTPVIRESHNIIAGYYPDIPGLEDVAILTVPTFETDGYDNSAEEFVAIAEYFVQNASQIDGKKKIVIDLQNNGGGVVLSGYGLYSIFFPNETLFSSTRFRSHEAIDFMGTIFNSGNSTVQEIGYNSGLSGLVDAVKPDQSSFEDWQNVFGPYNIGGIPSSALFAEFDFATTDLSDDPVNTDGRGGVLNATTSPFAPEDIVILLDGRCSSTCTIFADHMVSKGVKTVAVGGRPISGPMQALGGIKGSEVQLLSTIDNAAQEAMYLLNSSISGNPILSSDNISRFYGQPHPAN
ncbi:hypothetical protein UA08_02672 [Talaromyces atroroseus]|uniref:Uncharacterized protein n=1 Tax=Talaromyces atroroseus TaxID=1441469 RepID=A0A225B589_TALAT|nr:hypothetical protein UA08_02672 [Talaromyces atroroseus]OKL62436.1 hypothetical protein UA08_02672 [Talaromyces atroroseus]